MNNDERMTETGKRKQGKGDIENVNILPSAFLRKLRPEYYSDSSDITVYDLEQAHAWIPSGYNYSSATRHTISRFFAENSAKELICPNLRPATGPEGGGDSKADSETFAVAEEISQLFYVGEPNAGSERWAFAFSANERWTKESKRRC